MKTTLDSITPFLYLPSPYEFRTNVSRTYIAKAFLTTVAPCMPRHLRLDECRGAARKFENLILQSLQEVARTAFHSIASIRQTFSPFRIVDPTAFRL